MSGFKAGLCLAGVSLAGAQLAGAQSYPVKPVRVITAGVGSGNDVSARLVAQGLSAALGQQVLVDNRAAGFTMGQAVMRAPPDGYLLLGYSGTFWTAPLLQKGAPYDVEKDFSPISITGKAPNVLVVHPSLPVRSVKELIALAKARPGELNFSTGSTGSSSHLAGELFKSMAGVNMTRIPYANNAQEAADLIGGHVQLAISSAGSVMPMVKSGRLRGIAVGSLQPSALAPGLPTIAASGVPGYEAAGTYGYWAPAKTPDAIIRRLNQEIVRYFNTPEAKQLFLNAGLDAVACTPEEFAAYIRQDIARIRKLLGPAGG